MSYPTRAEGLVNRNILLRPTVPLIRKIQFGIFNGHWLSIIYIYIYIYIIMQWRVLFYIRERQHLCIKNLLHFSFVTQNVQMRWVRESQRRLSCIHRGRGKNLQCIAIFSPGQNLPTYIIFLTPAQILVVTSPACRLHNARNHFSFLHATHKIHVTFPPRTLSSFFI